MRASRGPLLDDFSNHPSTDVVAEAGACDGLPWHAAVSIGPYSVVIFSQEVRRVSSEGG